MPKMNKIYLLIPIFGMMLFGLFGFKESYFEISKNLELFTNVYSQLNTYYVDETQPGELMKTGIDAMMKSLDPYTVYYPESKIEDVRFERTGQQGGAGITLVDRLKGPTILDISEDSPALKSGLKVGDVLLKIDGNSTGSQDVKLLMDQLKGAKGTTFELEVEHINGEKDLLSIERAETQAPDIPYSGMLDDKTGYIALRSFTKTASRSVQSTFTKLEAEGMERLVLDLRGNGGGLLREAVNIVNLFVPKGQEVVSTRGKSDEWNKSYGTLNQPLNTDIPLVVLVNGRSASASEIVSGTLQDLDRAVVVGQQSFGKGLVQQTKKLSYNTSMKLTVAKYHTPSGRCIQKLNYSEKDEFGKVKAVPDSLIKPFKTAKGRPVYDGRGVDPDVRVNHPEGGDILPSLESELVLFDYANKYASDHESIVEPESFELNDIEYETFIQFVKGQDITIEPKSLAMLEKVKEALQEERKADEAMSSLEVLKVNLAPNIEKDMITFKPAIKRALEAEIVSRYHQKTGELKYLLEDDPDIAASFKVFDETYNSILQIQ